MNNLNNHNLSFKGDEALHVWPKDLGCSLSKSTESAKNK